MFLPEVTNSRLPTTFAPVVIPTSCLIEPRYSTLLDITASPSGGTGDWAKAGAGGARHATASAAGRRDLGMGPETSLKREPCAPGRVGAGGEAPTEGGPSCSEPLWPPDCSPEPSSCLSPSPADRARRRSSRRRAASRSPSTSTSRTPCTSHLVI